MSEWQGADTRLLIGDVREKLRELPEASVHCVVTSPPYWSLRDYGVEGQIGLEATPEEHVAVLVEVFREVRRVLRKDGVCWVNYGDCYACAPNGRKAADIVGDDRTFRDKPFGTVRRGATSQLSDRAVSGEQRRTPVPINLKPKDLVGMPWRVAFALQADGWWLRSDIIWHKLNPLPESVTDRPTRAHEYLFLLTRSASYFYDAEAIRELHKEPWRSTGRLENRGTKDVGAGVNAGFGLDGVRPREYNPAGRNKRTVWSLPSQPCAFAHFACVDDQTEALTPKGWKRHEELRNGDLIAEYDPNSHSWRWGRATFHRYEYDGDLVAIEKRDASQRLTANHRCLVRRRLGTFVVVEAADLKPGMEIPTAAPFGASSPSGIGVEWAELVGWFITEGHVRKGDGRVTIYQSLSANSAKVERIRESLGACGVEYSEYRKERLWRGRPSVEIEFYLSAAGSERLKQLAPEKAMTPHLAGLPIDEADCLLRSLVAGDGHQRKDGRTCVIQKDRASIDLMQLLAMRLGYRAMVTPRAGGAFTLYLTRGDWLTLRGTNGKHTPMGRERYKGTVWCPSVPTGFWIARRNGRPFITGNTFPEALVEPCILAGTSEWGCCWACGAPWKRVVERGGKRGSWHNHENDLARGNRSESNEFKGANYYRNFQASETTGWQPTCNCGIDDVVPCTVLDPFFGSGTVGRVANRLGRRAIGIELNPEYGKLAKKRTAQSGLGL